MSETALPAAPGTFAYWREQSFPNPADRANPWISGPAANPSGDGLENILRYAFGAGPYEPVAHLMPALVSQGSTRQFRFRYDPALTDLVWRVVASKDLEDWSRELFDSTVGPVRPVVEGLLSIDVRAYLGDGPEADASIFTRLYVELAE